MSYLFQGLAELYQRNKTAQNPPAVPKDPDALRIGILGAARIAPGALILPARSHPGVMVAGIAARDPTRARIFAVTHGIPRVYDTYQDLLDDPWIDAVYNPLPNSLHFEWTMRAIKAGKHVLLEKPSCNTADETRRAFEFAKSRGVVLLEAFHYRFHPAVQRLCEVAQSGELGRIKSLEGTLTLPFWFFSRDDVRFDWNMGAGCMLDVGVYPLSLMRMITEEEPISVITADATPAHTSTADKPIDRRTTAQLEFPDGITGSLVCDYSAGLLFPTVSMKLECARGMVHLYNFAQPTYYHYIQYDILGRGSFTEKIYTGDAPLERYGGMKGEAWWTTYRYQLEAFVDKVRGRRPDYWISPEDSIKQMEAVEMIYAKTGMGPRPSSSYTA